jgi:hypothetical protein
MKKLAWRASLCAGALSAIAMVPAHALTATFDDLAPTFAGPGDSFVSGGANFSVARNDLGFGVVDTQATLASFGNAPTGNATQYYAGFNDNFVTMTSIAAPVFSITSFDFGFIPSVASPNTLSPGGLMAFWIDVLGNTGLRAWDFGESDASGDWAFRRATWDTPDLTDGNVPAGQLVSVNLFACIYTANGCAWPANNVGQFAIDNIDFQLPLPGTWLLAGLGLAGLAVMRRRQAGAAAR